MVVQAQPRPQASAGIAEATEMFCLLLEGSIIGLKARVAGHAHWVAVAEASLALVTVRSGQALVAEAATRALVTAWALCSPEVTVTGWRGRMKVRAGSGRQHSWWESPKWRPDFQLLLPDLE